MNVPHLRPGQRAPPPMSVGQERPLSATLLEAFPLSSTRFGHASTPSSGLAKHDAGRQLQGVKSGNLKKRQPLRRNR
jgi:hypothetical protein